MNPYNLVEEWAKLNSALDKGWEPYRALVARRDEIEKEVPWLKGHGASPFPPKSSSPPPTSSSPLKPTTVIEENRIPGKSSRSEKEVKKRVEGLKGQGETKKSPSTVPMSKDQTQSFQGQNN